MKIKTSSKGFIGIFLPLGIIFLIAFIGLIVNLFHPDIQMKNLTKGDKISSHDSPNREYTINIYLIEGGHATVSDSIRGELVNNTNNTKKNIYWLYRENHADVEWIDDDTVVINEKKLNIHKDVYNWKKDKDLPFFY